MAPKVIAPAADEAKAAREALPKLRRYLQDHPDRLTEVPVVDADSRQELVLPRAALELLEGVLAHMAAGRGVSIVPAHAELTTQQAADMLSVSRPHLIGLLDAGEIEYRMVGTHRRVRVDSLLDYKRRDDQRRRGAADELSAMTRELGLD
ncbi:helix-turn-helix domain-containing protein [Nocardiopsis composta]|uniref:Excisionase family DNA binding protein n=1 Tax=Nocardiopsis composta TaxID=157465 RepID=A0A7W8VEA6_9ACTN|nr:helix-turn-helix domain-containing protein [Nocardiopsis composta]MBB5433107.1 excisionase family DNA binding protein [Nocardiopsis composta]HLU72972.1 helix-turn-helix domain-containing protein [Nonomuraea sp.]